MMDFELKKLISHRCINVGWSKSDVGWSKSDVGCWIEKINQTTPLLS
jgi:hypothetical protein